MLTSLPLRTLSNQCGSVLIPLIVGTAVFAVAAGIILTKVSATQKINSDLGITLGAERARAMIRGIVQDPRSWAATQTANASAFTAFDPSSPPALKLLLTDGTVYYNSKDPHAGFSPAGVPCTTSSSPSGNGSALAADADLCPFRYDITLKNHEQINGIWVDTVRAELRYSGTKRAFNTLAERYTFNLRRNFDDASAESACVSLGGDFNLDTGSCSTQVTQAATCSGSTYVRGPATTGASAPCATASPEHVTCPAGTVIKKFDGGNPVCGYPL
jgi:hypothetical protein